MLFALIFNALFALNIAQADKDFRKCRQDDFKAPGCSVWVKMNAHKTAEK